MRKLAVVVLFILTSAPAVAAAQAAIAGTVRDNSGGVIPGVTVEARSPVLLERSRLATTNSDGRYRIADLRPGVYTVSFTFTGWRPYQREGVELGGAFTVTLDAELVIGGVTESITVARDIPAIDIHGVHKETTLTGELVRALPTVRSYNALLGLVPGVVTSSNDTVTGTLTTSFPIHGGRQNEGRLLVDGLNVGSPGVGNSATNYVVDTGQAQEVTFVTAGGLGEVETAGLVMNIVPKAGGNDTHGSLFASGTGRHLQSNNLTQELIDQGAVAATPLTGVYDVSATLGGSIRRDRAWYFLTGHVGGSTRDSPNVYYNVNAGDSSKWVYAPDRGRIQYSDRTFENGSVRVTWQVTPRNKISGAWDAQAICRTCTGSTPGGPEPQRVSPEATGVLGRPLHLTQVTWTSLVNSRLVVEAGYGGTYFGVGNFEREPNPTRDLIRVTEQCATGCAANGNIPGLVYRSQDFSRAYTGSYLWKGSVTYVTGAFSLKAGYQHTLMTDDRTFFTNSQNLAYRFNNGRPDQLTQSISPWVNDARVAWNAVFAQGQWTRARLTLQGALRFDRAWSWFPEQREGPSRFLPTPIIFPRTAGVDSYKDITPRIGAAYDLVGTGRTALKVSLGRYLEGAGVTGNYANTNPSLRMPQTTQTFGTSGVTRAWTDDNQNFVPDCDLHNPAAQDLRPNGGDFCGVMSNTRFGTNVLTNNFNPAILGGWGVRPSDWNLTISIQQQLGSRSSIDVSYTRRSYGGFFVVDNLALQPSDLTAFSIVAPTDSRLPDGGGYVVSGLYDVVPEKSGQVDNLVTDAGAYGGWAHDFDGLDVTLNMRVGTSFRFIGGTSTGRTVADNCAVRERLPELATTTTGTSPFGAGLATSAVTMLSPYCRIAYGVLTQFRGLTSYIVPRIDVQLAATVQSKPGAMLAANYAVPNAAVLPRLGRDLSGNAANATVNLVEPGTMYGDRINQLDVRVAKMFRHGRFRTEIALDVYNTLNSSAVLSYNNTFVPDGPWLQPLAILTPRFLKLTAEIEF